MSELQGRVIAIAGAAGGLGPSVAERLAKDGATLALTDVVAEKLDQLVGGLGLEEDRFDARVVDLLDEEAARGWCAALLERFDRVDGLLHLVGGWRGGEPLAEAPLEDYEWLHDLLVRSVQRTSRVFRDALVDSGRGRFVLISAAQAQSPEGANASYAAAKAAAEAWTLALADDFSTSGSGATANIVVVNAILTPAMRAAEPEKEHPTFTPAEQIAEAIAFLCSEGAAKMNGKRLALHP